MGLLDSLLNKGQNTQQLQGFVNQFENGKPEEGYSGQDVLNHYMNVAPHVSNSDYVQAAEKAMEHLSPQQRQEFGQFMQQQGQQHGVDFGGLGQQLNPSTFQNDPNALAQMAGMFHSKDPGLLGSLASGVLGAVVGGGSGGALGGVLGSVLGGGHETQGAQGSSLGNIVEGVMGGKHDGQGGGGGILGNSAVKAALAGIAAMVIKQAIGGHSGSRR